MKILLWIFLPLLSILIIALLLLQTCTVQNFILSKGTKYLNEKLKTKVEIGSIDFSFPKTILLKDVFVADRKGDTLGYIHSLKLNVGLFGLLNSNLNVYNAELENAVINIHRSEEDSTFNYGFIIAAFASPTSVAKDSIHPGSAFNFKILNVALTDAKFNYLDSLSGTFLVTSVGSLQVPFEKFDLNKNKFHAGEIKLAQTNLSFLQTKPTTSPSTSGNVDYDVSFKKLSLDQVNVKYADLKQTASAQVQLMDVNADEINLKDQQLSFKQIHLAQSFIRYEMLDSIRAATSSGNSLPWKISCAQILLEQDSIKFDKDYLSAIDSGVDYNHLFVYNLNFDGRNFYNEGSSASADIKNLSALEQSGFRLNHLQGQLTVNEHEMKLENFSLQTNYSLLSDRLAMEYSSFQSLYDNQGEIKLDAHFKSSQVSMKEVLMLYPPLYANEYFARNRAKVFNLTGTVKGRVNDFSISNFVVKTNSGTTLAASGSIKGLPDISATIFDLKLDTLVSTAADVYAILPDSLIPSNISVPETINLSGQFRGGLNDFSTQVLLNSSYGQVILGLKMKNAMDTTTQDYKLNVYANSFDLGKLLKQSSVRRASFVAIVNGSGFSIEKLNADVNINITEMQLLTHNYHDIKLKGNVANQIFTGNATVHDKDMELVFDGNAGLSKDNAAYDFTMKVGKANLQNLGLYNKDITTAFDMNGFFTGSTLNDLNGNIYISNGRLISEDKNIALDTMILEARASKDYYTMNFRSGVANLIFTGSSSALSIIPQVVNHFNYYFNQAKWRSADTMSNQQFQLTALIHDEDHALPVFIDGLEKLDSVFISSSYSSDTRSLNIDGKSKGFTFNGVEFHQLGITVQSNQQKMDYAVSFDSIRQTTFMVPNPMVFGYVREDSIHSLLRIARDVNNPDMLIGARVEPRDSNYAFYFKPGEIILDQEHWNIHPDNEFVIGSNGYYAHNISLSNQGRLLSANSLKDEAGSPVALNFTNFDLSSLGNVLDSTGQLLGGIINGHVQLNDIPHYGIEADADIEKLKFAGVAVGDMNLSSKRTGDSDYQVALSLNGSKNDLQITGNYQAKDHGALNLVAKVDSFNLALAQPFTKGYVKNLNGNAAANIIVKGTFDKPMANGSITASHAGCIVSLTNAILLIGSEPVIFDETGIHFDYLSLKDIFGNKGWVNGDILTSDYSHFKLNLNVHTDNFIVLSSNSKINREYYGVIRLDSDNKITGDQDLPVIDSKVKLRKGTSMTYVYSLSDTSIDIGQGVVEFVDTTKKQFLGEEEKQDSVATIFSGYEVNTSLDVDDMSEFKIIIDPTTGDYISLKGNGKLSYSQNPAGRMTLSGRYEISDGEYLFNFYGVRKKTFGVKKGSSITWYGDPYSADVNITAYYTVRTSPVALMQDELAGASSEELKRYDQPLDFEVAIKMNGDLYHPEITFGLDLEQSERGVMGGAVYQKIVQLNSPNAEADLNKQVFGLLILDSFVPSDPLSGASGSNYVENIARGSASRILSGELNRLSSQYLKGLNLTFDVKNFTDYSTGAGQDVTALNVGLRQKFFNDRLQFYIGTNFYVGGGSDLYNQYSNFATDFTIEYLLNQMGSWRVNAFHKDDFENIFEGQVTETGGGLVFTKDFEGLADLMKRRSREEKINRISNQTGTENQQ